MKHSRRTLGFLGALGIAALLAGTADRLAAEEKAPEAGRPRLRRLRQLPSLLHGDEPRPRQAAVARSRRARTPECGRRRPATARATCRVAHAARPLRPHRPQLVLDQLRVGAGRRLPRHVHAGRVHARGDRPLPREERGAHVGDELHDLPARLLRVLGLRLRDRLGKLVQRPGGAGLVRRRSDPAPQC